MAARLWPMMRCVAVPGSGRYAHPLEVGVGERFCSFTFCGRAKHATPVRAAGEGVLKPQNSDVPNGCDS
eukprot:6154270-Prymnesium_polylepis.1